MDGGIVSRLPVQYSSSSWRRSASTDSTGGSWWGPLLARELGGMGSAVTAGSGRPGRGALHCPNKRQLLDFLTSSQSEFQTRPVTRLNCPQMDEGQTLPPRLVWSGSVRARVVLGRSSEVALGAGQSRCCCYEGYRRRRLRPVPCDRTTGRVSCWGAHLSCTELTAIAHVGRDRDR